MRRVHGERRRRRGFLLLPRRQGDEFRWLEWAEWEERYSTRWYGRTPPGWHFYRWIPAGDTGGGEHG